MKINGKKLEPHVEKMYLPHGEEVIEVIAHSIIDDKPFYKICKEPKPPNKIGKGNIKIPDYDDKGYKRELEDYNERRFAWMILTSIKITGGEWEKVNLNDPNTWLLWKEELQESGFNDIEITRIQNLMHAANCLDDRKLKEAEERFLATQLAREQSAIQKDALSILQSGEHVNGSASNHQDSQPTPVGIT